MSARRMRADLADARAMEEQTMREDLHSREGLYGAGKYIGAGATPSMGLSQFRGGAASRVGRLGDVSSAIVPFRPGQLAAPGGTFARPSMPASYYTGLFSGATGVRVPTRGAIADAPTTGRKLTSSQIKKALAMGIPLAAILGLGIAGAEGAFAPGAGGDTGYYPEPEDVPAAPAAPAIPPSRPMPKPTDMSQSELAWYLQSGNLPERYYNIPARRRGAGKKEKAPMTGRRAERAAIVKKVMSERGVSLPEASRIVKAEGLF